MQAKLLRVLQSGMFERVGGTETIKVNVRIVAATNKHLEEEVQERPVPRRTCTIDSMWSGSGFHRSANATEDIPLAGHAFPRAIARSRSPGRLPRSTAMRCKPCSSMTGPAMFASWRTRSSGHGPGRQATVLHRGEPAGESSLRGLPIPSHSLLLDIERSLPELTEDLIGQVEREYFVRLLSQYKGNVARCARHSGLSRRSVAQKLQKYGLERTRFKRAFRNIPADGSL